MLERFLNLEKNNIESAHLLYLTYFLAPEPIPLHILKLLTKQESAIRTLVRQQFLEEGEYGYSLSSETRGAVEHYLHLNRKHEKKYSDAIQELIKIMTQELVAEHATHICPYYLKQADFFLQRLPGAVDPVLLDNLEIALDYYRRKLVKETYSAPDSSAVAVEEDKKPQSPVPVKKSPPPIRMITKPKPRSVWGGEEIAGALVFFGLLGIGGAYLVKNSQGNESSLLDKLIPSWKK